MGLGLLGSGLGLGSRSHGLAVPEEGPEVGLGLLGAGLGLGTHVHMGEGPEVGLGLGSGSGLGLGTCSHGLALPQEGPRVGLG